MQVHLALASFIQKPLMLLEGSTNRWSIHALGVPRCDRALESARPKNGEFALGAIEVPGLSFGSRHEFLYRR
jgi:hypothetical protein